jgi:hypothetical protein
VQRASVWFSSIIVFGRLRFLGAFRDEIDAQNVFKVAYGQREVQRLQGHKLKPSRPRDIKLTDGSCVTSYYYQGLDDTVLCDDIRTMNVPQEKSSLSIAQWTVPTHHAPPSFAMLRGPSLSVVVDDTHSLLGRCDQAAAQLLLQLGVMREEIARGLSIGASPRLLHIGSCMSIAKRHCRIDWDGRQSVFYLRVLSPSSVFINGRKIVAGEVHALQHRSIIQVGTLSFYFLLPNRDTHCAQEAPLLLRRDLARSLIENLKLRGRIFDNGENTLAEVERDICAAIKKIDESEIRVAQHLIEPNLKIKRSTALATKFTEDEVGVLVGFFNGRSLLFRVG